MPLIADGFALTCRRGVGHVAHHANPADACRAHRAIRGADAKRVDFHNQRLHAIVAKPYSEDSEAMRVHRAVALAQLLIDVLAQTGDDDEHIPDAKVRVGIDTSRLLSMAPMLNPAPSCSRTIGIWYSAANRSTISGFFDLGASVLTSAATQHHPPILKLLFLLFTSIHMHAITHHF